jgi:hypothetical protein
LGKEMGPWSKKKKQHVCPEECRSIAESPARDQP